MSNENPVWESVKALLAKRIGEAKFKSWFSDGAVSCNQVGPDGREIHLLVATKFKASRIERDFQDDLERVWEMVLGHPVRVKVKPPELPADRRSNVA